MTKHYEENKELYYERAKAHKQKKKNLVRELKSKPCMDCGIEYPYYVMHFDHVRGEKKFNISSSAARVGIPALLEEIAKCEVVCANCHATRTWVREYGD